MKLRVSQQKLWIIVLVLFFFVHQAAAMTSTNYRIDWDSLNSGGLDYASSANYGVRDTFGQFAPGISGSANYNLQAGYRVGANPPILFFNVSAQDDSSQIAYSAFSDGGLTVTVADATGYVVDDYIVVIENKGPTQWIAMGKITDVNVNTLTVDAWEGDNGSMSAIPSGGDDYVYELTGNATNLGGLNITEVKTAVSFMEVSTNATNGYTVFVKEDHNLQISPGQDVDDVTDGAVSVGNEEYGIETVGQDAQGSGDFAITSSNQTVADSNVNVMERRTGIIYKAAVNGSTPSGNYSQIVSYYCLPAY